MDSMPVKYVMYSHLGYKESEDFKKWLAQKDKKKLEDRCAGLEDIPFIKEHLSGLQDLLTSSAHEGMLVLFYAAGFAECLDGIAAGKNEGELLQMSLHLTFAKDISDYINLILEDYERLAPRFRFITPLELYNIFHSMNWGMAQDLRLWFIGKDTNIRYDTPKIVEAIVRLRLLGTGIPLFRLDWDVLFRGKENKDLQDLGLFKEIVSCLKAYKLRIDEPSISTFLFSASYNTKNLNCFESWSRAFATRIFPALPVVPEFIKEVADEDKDWEKYADKVFDESLARKFYGLDNNELNTSEVRGIGNIGAHPLVSVISGAMLCLSDSAILDLPPFSNFCLNVSWIDDHLKYCLHRELRHLSSFHLTSEPGLGRARLDIMVQKARPSIKKLPQYILGNYLPTLLWGTIMDAWIISETLSKYRAESLCKEDAERWFKLKKEEVSLAVLTDALQKALRQGYLTELDEEKLREKLRETALKRITEVRKDWAGLTHEGKETFASIWAKGTAESYFPNVVKATPRCKGMLADNVPIDKEIKQITEINPFLYDDFIQLIRDAIRYIRWTLNWPKIVQVVRSVEQGTVKTDISWSVAQNL